MRKLAIFLFLVCPLSLFAQNYLREAVYSGDIELIQSRLGKYNTHYLIDFTNAELRILRNTIYAMHGYTFRSADLREHFGKFPWYRGTKQDVESELNGDELKLIRIITAMEAANPPTRESLIGTWGYPVTASVESVGLVRHYILSDGSIRGFDEVWGKWYLEGTAFRAEPDNKNDERAVWPVDWSQTTRNIRIGFVEYKGRLYKVCNFFGPMCYEATLPLEYWND